MNRIYQVLQREIKRLFLEFSRDKRGTAAIEFAFIFPVMLTIWLGSMELNNLLAIKRKVDLYARTLADLTARHEGIIDTPVIFGVWNAAISVLAPFDIYAGSTGTQLLGSSFSITSVGFFNGEAKVCWEAKNVRVPSGRTEQQATAFQRGRGRGRIIGTDEIPQSFRLDNTSLIWAEVQYIYKPTLTWLLGEEVTLKSQMFFPPRYNAFQEYPIQRTYRGLPGPNGECDP
jgi:hypothetical protein